MNELEDFASASLSVKCDKIDKSDRPPLDVGAVQKCHDEWKNGRWTCPYDDHPVLYWCGGKYWMRTGYLWKSSNSCYDYCRDCINSAIRERKAGVSCTARKGLAECYSGYWDYDTCDLDPQRLAVSII
ncbi:hypothetical protein EJ08DRAFT_100875 [Tothia fuscella]|uniref:Uncharacterized protein n=1 Tax=Tothia fuscella TaxID=1048955 RepID=A0A9P4U0L3_9PEZI|nr:hypothetical protein EJ08DRAFT_100875 [Tothia fuscella]